MKKRQPAETAGAAGAVAPIPVQVTSPGSGAVAAGGSASHNATAKGATVNDNRTYVTVTLPKAAEHDLPPQDVQAELDAYAERLRVLYGRLDLEVLIPTTEGEHPRMELRDVFVPPLLRADPPRVELPVELHRRLIESGELGITEDALQGVDRKLWEQARQAYRERPAVALLETLASAEAGRAVLLGDPGAGKSTVARYLALALASGALSGPLEPLAGLLPVVVELRRYAEADWRERSFEDFLAHLHEHERHAPSPALLRQCLHSGQALVVFDGLDELFDRQVRETVTRRITGFAARYPQVRIVITSRVIGYRRHLLDAAGFRHYMIQSLDDEQIKVFAGQWYGAVCPADQDEAKRLRTRLLDAVASSRPVRELAGNPLLLTILAIIARRQRLPRDRAGVYQHAVNVLIAHWDEDTKHLDHSAGIRAVADLDDRDRREMLERLARHMQSGEGGIAGNHVLAEDVENVFTDYLRETLQLPPAPATAVARAMVSQFRERNFILSRYGSEVYGFVHRAFLEYLAASDIVRRYEQRELGDEDLLALFEQQAPDPDWHEVLLLIVAQTGEHFAAQAVDTVLGLEHSEQVTAAAPPAVLALRALSEVRRIGRLTDQSIRTAQALVRYLQRGHFPPADIEQDLETSLSLLGHSWAGARHILRWLHTSDTVASDVCHLLIDDEAALKAVALAAPSAPSRSVALFYLLARWGENPAVHAFVLDRAAKDPDADVRSEVVDEIAGTWPDDPALHGFLRERAMHDPHPTVRQLALMHLLESRENDPEIRDFLKKIVADEAAQESRRAEAADELAYLARVTGDSGMAELFLHLAVNDASSRVRSSALSALALLCLGDHAVRDFLITRIATDPDEQVRRAALGPLARAWTEDPEVRKTVLAYATDSTATPIREQAILVFIAEYWPESEDDRALIRDWCTNSPDPEVRRTACSALGRVLDTDPGARALTLEVLSSDTDADVRRAVLTSMPWFEQNGLSMLRALQDHAVADPDAQCRKAALISLSQWRQDEDTRSLIATRAAEDSHEEVRAAARRFLDLFWPAPSAPGPLATALRERVLEDASDSCFEHLQTQLRQSPHPGVRVTAAQLLGTCWPADPRTVPALCAQADAEDDPRTQASIQEAAATATVWASVCDQLF